MINKKGIVSAILALLPTIYFLKEIFTKEDRLILVDKAMKSTVEYLTIILFFMLLLSLLLSLLFSKADFTDLRLINIIAIFISVIALSIDYVFISLIFTTVTFYFTFYIFMLYIDLIVYAIRRIKFY